MALQQDLLAAAQWLQKGDVQKARAGCQSVLSRLPRHPEALNMMAAIHGRAGEMDDAVACCLSVLEQHPDNLPALEMLGDILHVLEEHGGASEAFRRAVAVLEERFRKNPHKQSEKQRQDRLRLRCKLAAALCHNKAYDDAIALYRQVIAEGGANGLVLTDLKQTLAAAGRQDETLSILRDAVGKVRGSNRDRGMAWAVLGEHLDRTGHLPEATEAYRQALSLCDDNASLYYNYAHVLGRQFRCLEALQAIAHALILSPDHLRALTYRSAMLLELGEIDAAAEAARQAIALNPQHEMALTNLGTALSLQGKTDEGLAAHQKALAVSPELTVAQVNLGIAHLAAGPDPVHLDAARQAFTAAARQDPANATAQLNLALCALMAGDFAAGWRAYGWRWKTVGLGWAHCRRPLPRWDGGALPNRRADEPAALMVFGEQGIGDEMMFAGFLPALLTRLRQQNAADSLWMDCDRRLVPLFARSFPDVQFRGAHPFAEPPAEVRAEIPCGDLPRLLRPDQSSAPCQRTWLPSGYLRADPEQTQHLRACYQDLAAAPQRPLIGVAWFSRNSRSGFGRSLPKAQLRRLLALEEAPDLHPSASHHSAPHHHHRSHDNHQSHDNERPPESQPQSQPQPQPVEPQPVEPQTVTPLWISLQYGAPAELAHAGGELLTVDAAIDQMQDMDSFAAQVAALDLVICIDNSTAHLAGALGKETWLLAPFSPDWRWRLPSSAPEAEGTEGAETVWYPSLRLFRQPAPHDWNSVIADVHAALRVRFPALGQPLALSSQSLSSQSLSSMPCASEVCHG